MNTEIDTTKALPEASASHGAIPVPQYYKDTLCVGKYDYRACKDDELSFKKGDLMYITSSEADWWYAHLVDSDQKGYVPSNYIVEHNSLYAEK